MKSLLLGLLAETSIHPGAGQSAGFVDLPVAREAATDYPVIVGSSMKGALLDMARTQGVDEGIRKRVFGEQESAGALLVSDARLLLLPVRSLKSQYKWVTCPHLLERLSRDRAREAVANSKTGKSAHPTSACEIPPVAEHHYLGADDGDLFLEERQFTPSPCDASKFDTLVTLVQSLLSNEPLFAATRERVSKQLVVISDKDFVWFARYGLAINARNVLHETKKTSENLWYEETIPPDSLFYCLLAQRNDKAVVENDDALMVARKLFECRPYLQVGGNETVGQGWFAVALPKADQANGGAA